MSIDTKHPNYESINKHYTNGLILMQGSIAMRENKEEMLPKNQYETEYNYNARVKRTVLLNVYKETYEELKKKPFQEPPTWSDKLSKKLEFIQNNIDGDGTSEAEFYEKLVGDSLQFGKHMFLVNMPSLLDKQGELISPFEREEKNLNPFVSRVRPDSLINWYYNNKKLEMMSIQYDDEKMTDDGVELIVKVEIWTKTHKRIYEKSKEDGNDVWLLILEFEHKMKKIPFVVGGDLYDMPPLENLGELNVLHYGKTSDKDNNINIAMTPFLHFGGFDKDDTKATVSVHESYITTDTDSFIKWIEINGEGINIAMDDLTRLESRMKANGSDIITGKEQAKTATEKRIDNSNDMSTLQSICVQVEQSARTMMTLMCEWLSIKDPELTLTLFKDFNAKDQALQEVEVLQKMRMNEDISQKTLLNEVKARKVFKVELDVEQEVMDTELIQGFSDFEKPSTLDDIANGKTKVAK